ncbi:MAG: glucose-6-phosphate isomerase, partial [Mesorhizobium sp.]
MDRTAFSSVLAALKLHAGTQAPQNLRSAFAADPRRFDRFSLRLDDLLLDWSKTAVDDRAMRLLADLAEAAGLEARRDAMFSGEPINSTEGRAVLHVALRAPERAGFAVAGQLVMAEVHAVLARMGRFADAIRSGASTGATGRPITDVVNIGIGGSDLGPVMATAALAPFHDGPRAPFVSN